MASSEVAPVAVVDMHEPASVVPPPASPPAVPKEAVAADTKLKAPAEEIVALENGEEPTKKEVTSVESEKINGEVTIEKDLRDETIQKVTEEAEIETAEPAEKASLLQQPEIGMSDRDVQPEPEKEMPVASLQAEGEIEQEPEKEPEKEPVKNPEEELEKKPDEESKKISEKELTKELDSEANEPKKDSIEESHEESALMAESKPEETAAVVEPESFPAEPENLPSETKTLPSEPETLPVEPEKDTFSPPCQPENAPEDVQMTEDKEEEKKLKASSKYSSHPSYAKMVTEAIISLQERSGSSQQAIAKIIEAKHESNLPPNFRKMLSTQLKRLCDIGQLVKVKNSYKLSGKSTKKSKKRAAKPKVEKPKVKETKKAGTGHETTKGTKASKTAKSTKAHATKSTKAAKTGKAKGTVVTKATTSKSVKSLKAQSSDKKPMGKATTSTVTRKGGSKTAKALKPVSPVSTKRKAPTPNKKSLEKAAPSKRTTRSSK
ncbi:hypothetical protein KP509_30G041600 [Ceratopteris richardii]|uniref:H15 domain-containing protein n=1 Tax=Ceratopteris richardii TaxID=49495 RepID=A0A8T2R3D9_CERRI|nr:hypothetical protein KP509_30G041600 [Ceratopteris richardii]